ncbi:uncharacterized [Tachysurus ichikawai]
MFFHVSKKKKICSSFGIWKNKWRLNFDFPGQPRYFLEMLYAQPFKDVLHWMEMMSMQSREYTVTEACSQGATITPVPLMKGHNACTLASCALWEDEQVEQSLIQARQSQWEQADW